MPDVIAIDFETFYTTKYSVKNMIAEEYVRDGRFDAYLMSAHDGTTSWAGHPSEFPWHDRLPNAIVLAHNRYFDHNVWIRLHEQGVMPKPAWKEFHCTANLSSWYCNCRALAQAVEFVFNHHMSKQARTDMKDKHWDDLTLAQQRTMIEYAAGDVVWTWRLWDKLGALWPQWERDLSTMTIDQGMRGIHVNEELLQKYIADTYYALEATKKLIPWVDDGKAPSSSMQVANQCRKTGIPCPPLKTEDEEGFADWEETHSPNHPWIQAVSSFRSLSKLASTFDTMKRRLRADNTMPFSLKYFGAHTGRWSGDANMNMQNPRKESILINENGLMETDKARIKAALAMKKKEGAFPTWVKSELNFRHLLDARPGMVMGTADLRQIEPRVLAWCAKDTESLAMLANGVSPYVVHARRTMGWADETTQETDPKGYALAKARVLGLGYGCGWEKFIKVARMMAGLDITAEDPEFVTVLNEITGEEQQISGYGWTSKQIVKAYRDSNPKIVDLWRRLDEGFKGSIGEDFVMNLPSGRKMVYRGVKREIRIVPDPDNPGKTKSKAVYTADIGGRREIFYGGKLAENLVQAISRDVFGFLLLLLLQEKKIFILFTSHDEVIVEMDPSLDAKYLHKIMSTVPPWLRGCPVDAEAKIVPHYCK